MMSWHPADDSPDSLRARLASSRPVVQAAPGLRKRYDKFGGLAWTPRGCIFKLSSLDAVILDILRAPRYLDDVVALFGHIDAAASIAALHKSELVIAAAGGADPSSLQQDCSFALLRALDGRSQSVNKPFWAHLQPFVFCNQRCIHCYCHGDAYQPRLPLSLETWKAIIDEIVAFGVIEVYVTGGETFLVKEYFEIAQYILNCGCTTGLSTNAMSISKRVINFITQNEFDVIQVSLDGATPVTNDRIRGVRGAFNRSIDGIRKLRSVTNPVINMVVNRWNVAEIEALIVLGCQLGVDSFKFYPQKTVGRAVACRNLQLSDDEWFHIPFEALAASYGVTIEYLARDNPCGSGHSGFAIDEHGMFYPCIFGTHNPATTIGSVLSDSLEYLWFDAPRIKAFRALKPTQPCTRCECK